MAYTEEYIPVICIGAGLSGICIGVQLQRKLRFTKFRIYEECEYFGGTWWVNTYPGCACDIPGALYSFSFAPNPHWSGVYPPQRELLSYIKGVADTYHLAEKTTFRTRCERAEWDTNRKRWLVTLRNLTTDTVFVQECSVLVSAVGGLNTPKPPSAIADFTAFKGKVFHSARWDHSVSLDGKDVVVVGNGCSATQFIPHVASKARSLNQVVRSSHWILPPIPPKYPPRLSWVLENIPFALCLFRIIMFITLELHSRMFSHTVRGAQIRDELEEVSRSYVTRTAPAKYHDLLVPDFKIGCKRRIYDSGYLETLHRPNVDLIHDRIIEILPDGVRTETGTYPADVVVLATGFDTLLELEIRGRNGITLQEHWTALGGPGAYDGIACSGFPNFIMLLGPNWGTGHTSTILTIENETELAIKLMKPVLDGKASTFEVKAEEEVDYVQAVQKDLRGTVWTGCSSWYKSSSGWNSILYPWSQLTLWWRCHFPRYSAWTYAQ